MMAAGPPADLAEIRRALTLLLEPGGVAELRVLHAGRDGTVSGYFNDHDALAREAARWSGKAPGVYVTLNPVLPALLARAANRARTRAEQTTSDRDIVRRRWLGIDLDPVRPAGISATEAEHRAALIVAHAVRAELRAARWPDPFVADSGNGGHLGYRVDLPNDDASTALLSRCLQALALRFDDDAVRVDLKTFNPARIWKVYGTLAAKGDATADRPHRLARLLDVPDARVVSREQLIQLAATVPEGPADPSRSGPGPGFDLEAWLARSADRVHVVRRGPWNGGERWILNPCPWNAEHANGAAYVVRFAGGAIAAGCHHNGCAGRDWAALRELVAPGWREHRAASDGAASVAVTVHLSTVRPVSVNWVWPARLALGKLTVLSGDPGLGKSLLVLDTAARISRGSAWPDRGTAPRGSVVILSAEDGIADTIAPRFLAMGGDPTKVHVLQAVRTGDRERPFDLTSDLAVLETLVAHIGDVVLIGVDPIGAYLGKTDSHRDASMRGVLLPLAAMAERVGAAVAGVAHLNKATKETNRKALYRTTGSIALPAAARMAFVVGEHPEDPERRVLVHQKNNLAPVPPTLGFRIVATADQVARVEWDEHPVAGLTADDVLTVEAPDPAEPAVVAFLATLLAHGPVPAAEARRQAAAEGFSEPTVRRARQRLGVSVEKRGMAGGWHWVPSSKTSPSAPSPGSDAFDVFVQNPKTSPSAEDVTLTPRSDAFVTSSKESTTYNTFSPEDVTSREASRARARGLVEVPAKSFLRQSMPTHGVAPGPSGSDEAEL